MFGTIAPTRLGAHADKSRVTSFTCFQAALVVRPVLQHGFALLAVFSLVVDSARAFLFVAKASSIHLELAPALCKMGLKVGPLLMRIEMQKIAKVGELGWWFL